MPTVHAHALVDDILRARLRTLGVEEYHMSLESGTCNVYPYERPTHKLMILGVEKGTDWIFYDVGGSRNQRGKSASSPTVMGPLKVCMNMQRLGLPISRTVSNVPELAFYHPANNAQ